MIYNNLLVFITAIFLFSIDTVPAKPMFSSTSSLLLFLLLLFWFNKLAYSTYKKPSTFHPGGYFSAEKKLSVIALLFFAAALHLCDAKYYLSFLSIGGRVPSLVNISGLALLLLFLSAIWQASYRNYQVVFGHERKKIQFVLLNIRANLPIVLPWIGLSLLSDLITLLPWPWLHVLSESQWGDLLFFGLFLFFVLLFFPPMVRRLWGCKKLEEGTLKRELTTFCHSQNFKADLYIWPLFEGRVPTAGVMGIIPGLRYILITPALIETMSTVEMEAVMAHEIGHVKRFHMLLYLLLIGGFSLLAGALTEPAVYFILSRDFFYSLIEMTNMSLETVLTFSGSVPLLLIMLLYFRFLFGYFIRNFERQADLYSFTVLGNSSALVSAFEKLARVTGNSKDEPNWHHFSLGERIEYLQRCRQDPTWVTRHNRKVYISLLAYLLALALGVYWSNQLPKEQFIQKYEQNYTDTIVAKKLTQEPNNPLWLQLSGDIMLRKKMEKRALTAYEKALQLEPTNPVILNNLAWLLITSEDLQIRDPAKALTLARTAVVLQPKGFILDTLATAFWANNYLEEAIMTEAKAITVDPAQRRYYQSRIDLFQQQSYKDSLGPEGNTSN